MNNPYQNALDVQDACNLSGIVHQFSRDFTKIREEAKEKGWGTKEINEHPACRLYAEKILQLSGGGMGHCESFHVAYNKCLEMTKNLEKGGPQ